MPTYACSTKFYSTTLQHDLGEYDYYVIMPHFYENSREACRIISQVPPEKLLILDKYISYPRINCKAVYQDFARDIYDALKSGLHALCKYDQLVYVHPALNPHPQEIIGGFKKFCSEYQFEHEITEEISTQREVRKGQAYIVIEESDLAHLIRLCEAKKLRIGKDVGILSYNESPIKQMLIGGISVITTDHAQMGETAARLILDERNEKVRIPFRLILRGSL
jgi:DNA-binding LacI/PurR family transcriptional regulator